MENCADILMHYLRNVSISDPGSGYLHLPDYHIGKFKPKSQRSCLTAGFCIFLYFSVLIRLVPVYSDALSPELVSSAVLLSDEVSSDVSLPVSALPSSDDSSVSDVIIVTPVSSKSTLSHAFSSTSISVLSRHSSRRESYWSCRAAPRLFLFPDPSLPGQEGW